MTSTNRAAKDLGFALCGDTSPELALPDNTTGHAFTEGSRR